MARTLPNVPLWPRAGLSGRRAAASSSVSSTAPSGSVLAFGSGASRRNPTLRSAIPVRLPADGCLLQIPNAFETGEDPTFAIVQPLLDVEREQEAAAGGAHAERDRDRVIGLVADRQGDALHAELPRPALRATVQPDGWLACRQAFDLDVAPPDAADTQPENLRHGLLRGPATGHRFRPVAHVPLLGGRQDSPREAAAKALERSSDPLDPDDVDPQFGRARRHVRDTAITGRLGHAAYSTVTDLARLRGWSTSVP